MNPYEAPQTISKQAKTTKIGPFLFYVLVINILTVWIGVCIDFAIWLIYTIGEMKRELYLEAIGRIESFNMTTTIILCVVCVVFSFHILNRIQNEDRT